MNSPKRLMLAILALCCTGEFRPVSMSETSYQMISTNEKRSDRPPDKSAYWKFIFFLSHPHICCGYSKEPSQ